MHIRPGGQSKRLASYSAQPISETDRPLVASFLDAGRSGPDRPRLLPRPHLRLPPVVAAVPRPLQPVPAGGQQHIQPDGLAAAADPGLLRPVLHSSRLAVGPAEPHGARWRSLQVGLGRRRRRGTRRSGRRIQASGAVAGPLPRERPAGHGEASKQRVGCSEHHIVAAWLRRSIRCDADLHLLARQPRTGFHGR